jgi:hypothetical protein
LRTGVILHSIAALGFVAGSGLCLLWSFQQPTTSTFALLMLASLFLFAPAPFVIYRGYALLRAEYILERDGLQIRWGLRAEDIPLTEIQWVRPASDLAFDLPLPRFQWPGAVLGAVKVSGLGEVEFLAADIHRLVLVGASQKVYALSPADPEAFLRSFERAFEMGSLLPMRYRTVLATSFLAGVWHDRWARILTMTGLLLTLFLFLWVSMVIPGRSSVSLGFSPTAQPLPPAPANRLLLLPVLGGFIYLIDLIIGFFFYRRDEMRPMAYLLWGSSAVSPILLILATIMITSV